MNLTLPLRGFSVTINYNRNYNFKIIKITMINITMIKNYNDKHYNDKNYNDKNLDKMNYSMWSLVREVLGPRLFRIWFNISVITKIRHKMNVSNDLLIILLQYGNFSAFYYRFTVRNSCLSTDRSNCLSWNFNFSLLRELDGRVY